MPSERIDRLLLAGLLLLNLVLKCCWLDLDPLFNDEPFTVYWSQRPLDELWTMLATENNPPLYFLLIKAWSQFVPFDEAWLRVPAALFSAGAVAPLFLVARQFAGTRAALLTGLVFSFSNYHYAYAHEVRAYALFTALACTSVWLLLRDRSSNSWWSAIALGMVNTAMVYTHFFGWLMVGLQFLLVLLPLGLQPSPKRCLRACGITLVAFVPYGSLFALRLGQSVSNGTWLERPSPEELYNMLWRWSNAPVMVVLFVALVCWGGFKDRFRSPGLRLGLVWALAPLLGMYFVSFFVPLFLDRYRSTSHQASRYWLASR